MGKKKKTLEKKTTAPVPKPLTSKERRIRRIFNGIDEHNFSINVEKVKELAIDSHQNVCLIMNQLFDKATVSDKPRAQMYARLCRELQKVEVPDGNKPEKMVNFRKLVISRQ